MNDIIWKEKYKFQILGMDQIRVIRGIYSISLFLHTN